MDKQPKIVILLSTYNGENYLAEQLDSLLKQTYSDFLIIIRDDGPGFPKDLIEKDKLGEPYIRTANPSHISKYGLGLGTFIGKTLLEKNYANIFFKNSRKTGGAEVIIKWKNKDLIQV